MKKIASQYRNDFWKHAKGYGKQIEVEELYDRWSIRNRLSKNLDVQVRSLIQNDINNIRTALTFSGTPEELKEYMNQMGNESQNEPIDMLSPSLDDTSLGNDLDPSLDSSLDVTPVSQDQPINNEGDSDPLKEQQVLPDMINS